MIKKIPDNRWERFSQLEENLTSDDVIKGCLHSFGKEYSEIFNGSRKAGIVEMRSIIFLILRSNGLTYHDIGNIFDMDHTSVMHIFRTIKNRLDHEERLVIMLMRAIVQIRLLLLTSDKAK